MLSEDLIVYYSHYVIIVVSVLFFEELQNFEFDTSLVLKALFVADNFNGHILLRLVIEALDGLAEAASAKHVNNLKSIANVVVHHDLVISTVIIVAKVVLQERAPFDFLGTFTHVVNLRILLNLNSFIICEVTRASELH